MTTDRHDFIDRNNTHSIKWDNCYEQNIISLSVADMDFPSPNSIIKALKRRIDHGIFGYTKPPESLYCAVSDYIFKKYHWNIDNNWIVWIPGTVTGINLACRTVGSNGDSVITALPIYPPFLKAPALSKRKLITVKLINIKQKWYWDFAAIEKAVMPNTKLLLLCNPHNPVGRSWRIKELNELLKFAKKHKLIVCSDEVHCDLILDKKLKHIPFATIDEEFSKQTITLMSPSKTWNIAGLYCSFAIIPDNHLRSCFQEKMQGIVPHINLLGYIAAEAAYRDKSDWYDSLIKTLRKNRQRLINFFKDSNLKLTIPEATYLAWIDARSINKTNPKPEFDNCKVSLSDGADFGLPGWLRLNFACDPNLLEEALTRIKPLIRYNK